MRHVIAIDQGTTGTTVLILDEELRLRGRGYREFPQIYPQPGWVEHDPEAIWASVTGALGQALAAAKLAPADIAAIDSGAMPASACASAAVTELQMSTGSCSTQPGFG